MQNCNEMIWNDDFKKNIKFLQKKKYESFAKNKYQSFAKNKVLQKKNSTTTCETMLGTMIFKVCK